MNETGFDDIVDTIHSWVRWSWLIVLAAVAGAGLAVVGDDQLRAAEPTASATLGLNNAVIWPYHEAVLAQHAGDLADPAVRTEVAEATGIEATVESKTGVSTIKVTVEAATEDAAVTVANALAEAVVARGRTAAEEFAQAKVPPLRDSLAASQKRAEATQAELAAQRARYTTLAPGTVRDDLGTQIERLIRDLNAELDVSNVIRAEIAQAERALGAPLPGMEVLEPARSVGATSSQAAVAVLGGVALFVLALLLVPLLERRFGRVRTDRHAELTGLGIDWVRSTTGAGPLPVGSAADLVTSALARGAGEIALLGVPDAGDATAAVSATRARTTRTVLDAGGVESPHATATVLRTGRALVLARAGRTSRRQLAVTLRRLASLGVDVEAVVLLDRAGRISAGAEVPAVAGVS